MDDLLNVTLRHQIYLEGLKGGRNVQLVQMLAQLDRELKRELAFVTYDKLSDMSRTALYKLTAQLKKTARTIFDVWLNELIRWLEEYMTVDAEFWNFAYSLADPENKSEFAEAEAEQQSIWAGILNLPMAANGILALSFLKAFGTLATDKIGQQVFISAGNAETPKQLLARISGTAAAKHNDGLLGGFNRSGQAVTNTVIQHIAAQTNAAIMAKAWPAYVWCSVIDDATTKICFSRNGQVYLLGAGPIPPAHVGCRSSIFPFAGGDAPNMPSFKMWASSQSEAFVKDAFDGNAPSRYEGSKAINLDEFRAKRSLILS